MTLSRSLSIAWFISLHVTMYVRASCLLSRCGQTHPLKIKNVHPPREGSEYTVCARLQSAGAYGYRYCPVYSQKFHNTRATPHNISTLEDRKHWIQPSFLLWLKSMLIAFPRKLDHFQLYGISANLHFPNYPYAFKPHFYHIALFDYSTCRPNHYHCAGVHAVLPAQPSARSGSPQICPAQHQ